MDSLNSTSAPTKTKFSHKFHKFIRFKSAHIKQIPSESDSTKSAAAEAFIAKIFAVVSVIKASYAELQIAQIPYNADTIKSADESVISELTLLSDLEERFYKNEVESSSPHVTLLLSEIQEQQSLIKMYEISISKMEHEIEAKKSECNSIRRELKRFVSKNKLLEKRLKCSASFSVLDDVKLSDPNTNDFIKMLNYAIRSVRNFVKLLVREMQFANWNIEVAAKSIEPEAIFDDKNHICFVFESFVYSEMFDRFNDPNFGVRTRQHFSSDEFNKLKSANSIDFLNQNRRSKFAHFVREKYLCLVHEKMEASFSGNLNQRKKIGGGEFPETEFFGAFVEMGRRVWLLHCLGSSFEERVKIFQVRRKCRFSEVYMENITGGRSIDDAGNVLPVTFTVVPGFKVGRTVIQSQVYLSPALTPEC